jgi:hypothetical protein
MNLLSLEARSKVFLRARRKPAGLGERRFTRTNLSTDPQKPSIFRLTSRPISYIMLTTK